MERERERAIKYINLGTNEKLHEWPALDLFMDDNKFEFEMGTNCGIWATL